MLMVSIRMFVFAQEATLVPIVLKELALALITHVQMVLFANTSLVHIYAIVKQATLVCTVSTTKMLAFSHLVNTVDARMGLAIITVLVMLVGVAKIALNAYLHVTVIPAKMAGLVGTGQMVDIHVFAEVREYNLYILFFLGEGEGDPTT